MTQTATAQANLAESEARTPAPAGAEPAARPREGSRRWSPEESSQDAFLARTIEEVARLEQQARGDVTFADRLAERVSSFSGSMTFVILHVLWFGGWIIAGLGVIPGVPGDRYPFQLLTMVVSLEAIFLSAFVLLAQNRQSRQAERRAKVALQMEVIGEREITRMMGLVFEIHDRLGLNHEHDPEIEEMQKKTRIQDLATAAEKMEDLEDAKDSAKGEDR